MAARRTSTIPPPNNCSANPVQNTPCARSGEWSFEPLPCSARNALDLISRRHPLLGNHTCHLTTHSAATCDAVVCVCVCVCMCVWVCVVVCVCVGVCVCVRVCVWVCGCVSVCVWVCMCGQEHARLLLSGCVIIFQTIRSSVMAWMRRSLYVCSTYLLLATSTSC